jgi:hypothetical protein
MSKEKKREEAPPHIPTAEYVDFQRRIEAGKKASFRQKLSKVFGEPDAVLDRPRRPNPRPKS